MRVLAVLLLFLMGSAWGQSYPSRPITMLLGFVPGGSLDPVARQVAAGMQKDLGQVINVENRPGATGTIAGDAVAHAAPDGYTLLFGVGGNLAIAPVTMKRVPYDPTKAFAPISLVARGPYVLSVNAAMPVESLADLKKYAGSRPGRLNYGSAGVGSVQNFAGELLNHAMGLSLTHIPYKGGGQAWPALMNGDIHFYFDTMPGPLMFLGTGKIRPIAVTGSKRLPSLPDVPTFTEQGFPSVDVHFMYGIVAPAGTPADIVARLNRAVRNALGDPEVKAILKRQEIEPSPSSPEEFGKLIDAEGARWKQIAAQTGFEAQ